MLYEGCLVLTSLRACQMDLSISAICLLYMSPAQHNISLELVVMFLQVYLSHSHANFDTSIHICVQFMPCKWV